jgi:hypothetical protein
MNDENGPASSTRLERQPRCSSVHCSTGAIMKVPRPVPHTQIPETEFLDIILSKDSSLLLHAIHILFYWRTLRKTIVLSGFKNPYKKIRETRELESFHE